MYKRLLQQVANISIRNKLMLLITLVCGPIVVLTTTIYLIKDTFTVIQEQHDSLESLSEIIAKNVAASLLFDDQVSALDTMDSLKLKPDIIAAYILHTNSTIFSRYIASDTDPTRIPLEQLPSDATEQEHLQMLGKIKADAGRISILRQNQVLANPIMLDDQNIGTVVLFADHEKLKRHLAGAIVTSVAIFILATIVTYLLSIRFQGMISSPILNLSAAMLKLAESKDFSLRVKSPGKDEVGQLYDGFNEMLQEIEERDIVLQQRQMHLQELAHFDTLTRLPNRVLFHDRLKQAINLAQRTKQLIAVMFLDLDCFKDVNDSLGHRTGDLLLKQVGERMNSALRDCDTVARQGGDEFTIFAQNIKELSGVDKIAQKLIDLFDKPFWVDGNELYVTCSIGITIFPNDADNIDALLMNADMAMYQAKAAGKNAYRLYNAEMNQQAGDRIVLRTDLRKAQDQNQLFLLYQPKGETQSGKVTGVEALLRWQHPERGLVSPALFIPLAEEGGIIHEITEWVLRTACRQAKQWQDDGLGDITVAVNLSAYSLKRHNVPMLVQEVLTETGLPAKLLELELTESLLIENDHQAESVLDNLKQIGVSIAIDDFGTGYSSLAYLHRFPIDCLKIDRSFIWNMHRSDSDQAIVSAIIAMAQSLKLRVVAEGVETAAQLDALRACGCDIVQGYLLSKPVLPEELGKQLNTMQLN